MFVLGPPVFFVRLFVFLSLDSVKQAVTTGLIAAQRLAEPRSLPRTDVRLRCYLTEQALSAVACACCLPRADSLLFAVAYQSQRVPRRRSGLN